MQIHNIMVLIFITCLLITVFHAFVYVCYAFFSILDQ